jgi:hypothetical protein
VLTDGFKGPYTWGKDFFEIGIFPNRLTPVGTAEQEGLLNYAYSFSKGCSLQLTTSANGHSCTAWVIYNENMDYLHCNDLSWGGKTKCE